MRNHNGFLVYIVMQFMLLSTIILSTLIAMVVDLFNRYYTPSQLSSSTSSA
jgi:hypothetical protein